MRSWYEKLPALCELGLIFQEIDKIMLMRPLKNSVGRCRPLVWEPGILGQWGFVADDKAIATIRAGFEEGITLFDAAESYGVPHGRSEELLGRALSGIRHQVTVVTKIGNWGKREGFGAQAMR